MNFSNLKTWLVGHPLPTSASEEERLSNTSALAILSSDALSSVAYATQEILAVLILAGNAFLGLSLPISISIIVLLSIITLSYRQTIRAYPFGGGAYRVVKENIGLLPGLVAASALMIDYTLTVAVSVSAGIAALTSAIPSLDYWTLELCLVLLILLTVANLRGLRSSGRIFSIPTFAFIACIFLLIGTGLYQEFFGTFNPLPLPQLKTTEPLTLFLICKAFSAGCTALTGVEAISDGVMVFYPPEWKNARQTLLGMVILLGFMFVGITYIAHAYNIIPQENGQTVLSLIGHQVFGNSFLYYFLQITTLLILMLAANTSFADFPRLSYFLAKDSFLPRQLTLLGDRLVYSNGIILLSICAGILLIIFRGETTAIIPLYAVGVFTSFTLSQAGMVMHWYNEKSKGWQWSAIINGLGSCVTLIVLVIITLTKFKAGAWLVIVTIPILVKIFLTIYRHYRTVSRRLSLKNYNVQSYPQRPKIPGELTHCSIVIVGQIHRGTIEAINYARSISHEIIGVHVDLQSGKIEKLKQEWQDIAGSAPLYILESPYRSVIHPLVEFVGDFESQLDGRFCTVIIPVFVTRKWWENLLHNQTATFLRNALRAKKNRVITYVRYYL